MDNKDEAAWISPGGHVRAASPYPTISFDAQLLQQQHGQPSLCEEIYPVYCHVRLIGRGGQGRILGLLDGEDDAPCMMMKVYTSEEHQVQVELDLWGSLPRHENILRLVGHAWWSGRLCALFPALPYDSRKWSELHASADPGPIILDTLQGIEFLDHHGLTHCDIKASNVLVDHNGKAKICDFSSMRRRGDRRHLFLTERWAAPEVLCDETLYSPKSDMWSLGCFAFELYSGRSPFSWVLPDNQDPHSLRWTICNLIVRFRYSFCLYSRRRPIAWTHPRNRQYSLRHAILDLLNFGFPPFGPEDMQRGRAKGMTPTVELALWMCLSREPAERPTAGDLRIVLDEALAPNCDAGPSDTSEPRARHGTAI